MDFIRQVTIYTTPTCGYCKMTKQFFHEHHIEFHEIDVSSDVNAARAMIEKSGQMGVPVISVLQEEKETIIVGFDQLELEQVLGVN